MNRSRSKRPTVAVRLVALLAAALFAPALAAAERPTGGEANRTIEYYYSDSEAPVLMRFRVCSEILDEGKDRHECASPVDTSALTAGMEVVLWMKFLVPHEATPRIRMRVEHNGRTRDTFERTLRGAVRYRTWNRVELTRAGSWQVRLFHDAADGARQLYGGSLEVAPATSGGDGEAQ